MDKWTGWRSQQAPRVRHAGPDALLARYINKLFFDGQGIAAARHLLHGYIYINTVTSGSKSFPQAARALKGWEKASPGACRDPLPVGIVAVMCEDMIRAGDGWAAMAAALQVDIYARPSELLALNGTDLVKPEPKAGETFAKHWAVIIAGSDTGRTTKTGDSDHTVLVGDKTRFWLKRLLRPLARLAGRGPLIPLTLPQYEAAFRRSASRLDLVALRPCPHMLRHAGPSHDAWTGVRDLHDIQKRGNWEAFASVKRYEKHGKLLRQIARAPDRIRDAMVDAEQHLPKLLGDFLACQPCRQA